MPLKHPKGPAASTDSLSVPPLFTREDTDVPRHELPEGELPPDVAYQIIHDELMLDGNARLNVATFVTTWMEPQAEQLMAECFDKNMIDKDEYPQTAEIEMRCVNILSRLWHAPDADEATGCSTTGSSEAAMLGGLALKRRWQHRRKAAGEPADRPNIVMGINVQVCWEKFANYWDVEMRLVPMEGDRFHISADGGRQALRREHDRRRRHPRLDVRRLVRAGAGDLRGARRLPERDGDRRARARRRRVRRVRRPVPRPRPRLGLPAAARRLDQRVRATSTGSCYPGVGWVVWRDAAALPEDLIFWVNYLGDNMPTFALNFSRPGAQVVAQYYNFLRLGFDGYRSVQGYAREVATRLSARIARAGPVRADHEGRRAARCSRSGCGTRSTTTRSSTSRTRCASAAGRCPPTRSRRTARTSPRFASSSGAASPTTSPNMLVGDLERQLPRLEKQPEPVHESSRPRASTTSEPSFDGGANPSREAADGVRRSGSPLSREALARRRGHTPPSRGVPEPPSSASESLRISARAGRESLQILESRRADSNR